MRVEHAQWRDRSKQYIEDYRDETSRAKGSLQLYGIFGKKKTSFLFHASRPWVLICGSHMLQMLPSLLWSDHHDKGTACSINR